MSAFLLNLRRGQTRTVRLLIAGAVVGLTLWLLQASWLRWVDPQIDFGREVFLPWRILQGEHPGRDFIHPYGPLSVYFNAGLMGTFGVAVRTLVITNLVIFAGIVFSLHTVLRRAFGFLPAAVATAIGVAVFGFPHYWGINNYTYAAPYSHEATHGMALLLALLAWIGRPATGRPKRAALVSGALIGLCCLTKSEFALVSLGLGLFTVLRAWFDPIQRPGIRAVAGGLTTGFALVLAGATALLACALRPAEAIHSATNALFAPFTYSEYSRSAHVLHFLGADNLWNNLRTVLLWGSGTLGVLALVTVAGRLLTSRDGRWPGLLFLAAAFAAAGVAVEQVPWVFCGTVFPVLLAAAAATLARQWRSTERGWRKFSHRRWNQAIALVAGVGMLGRMAFDPTISHYGFFQAMLAGTWLVAFLLGVWPHLVASTKWARWGLIAALLVLLGGGAVKLVRTSLRFYAAKQFPVGEGADRILAYPASVYALPHLWEQARQYLVAHGAPGSSLLVVPEGLSLNYWTRQRHPLRIADLLPATLRLNDGDVVAELAAHPPDTVVLVSRPNLEEVGIKAYGQDAASGKRIIDWVRANYTLAAKAGGDPLANGSVGLQIYRRK